MEDERFPQVGDNVRVKHSGKWVKGVVVSDRRIHHPAPFLYEKVFDEEQQREVTRPVLEENEVGRLQPARDHAAAYDEIAAEVEVKSGAKIEITADKPDRWQLDDGG